MPAAAAIRCATGFIELAAELAASNDLALDYGLLSAGKAFNADDLVGDIKDSKRPAATVRTNEFHPAGLAVSEKQRSPACLSFETGLSPNRFCIALPRPGDWGTSS
jgi:hypothetical protein